MPEAIWEMIKWCGIIICFFFSLYLFLKYVISEEETEESKEKKARSGVQDYINTALRRSGVKS